MSATQSNLLVEVLAEELPPKALKKLSESFAQSLAASLKAQGLCGDHAAVTPFATPRRLAVHISAVEAQAADRSVTHKLMPVTVALDAQGQATPALLKKLAALGADASAGGQLERRPDGKTEALFWTTSVRGATLAAGLQVALDAALAALPIPKLMSYQLADGWTSVNFVRPVHGLVALHGAEVVPIAAFGLAAGRSTQGHRFEGQRAPVVLRDADQYAQQMASQAAVMVSFGERRAEIVRQLQRAAALEGLTPIDDDALLDEVTALVERPNVLLCRFEPEFLAVPPECLILTMKANQKYFPLLNSTGQLTEKFLVVSNIRPDDPSAIIEGNQRVIRPRLADAKFFFDQDCKKTLVERLHRLDKIVYHNKLGSQGERRERVVAIAREVAMALAKAQWLPQGKTAHVNEAASLAKADLLTDMVGEFPELQGVMGGYYARNDGKVEDIAMAIEDHYKPRFAGDSLARNEVGVVVALADKLETLAGLFGVGERPTGDKDPFALRRHALGVIRMLVERDLPVSVPDLISAAFAAFAAFPSPAAAARDELMHFIYERLVGYLRELGYSAQEVDAVISLRPPRWADLPKRLAAVRTFIALPEAASLAAANKRIANILKKSDATAAAAVDPALLTEPAERALAAALHSVQPLADALFDNAEYAASLRELAVLKAPVDAFFDSVMVNADDPALRANRLALLAALHAAMNRIADLSKLAT